MILFKRDTNKRLLWLVLIVGIVAIALACFIRFWVIGKAGIIGKSIITSSTLKEAIDIAELSTGEFKYRGIAEIYKDENKTDLRCRVCYNAVVKAGVDMGKVQFDVDTDQKMVYVTLPEISLKVMISDEESLAVLPSDAQVEISEMLKAAREDAETEANQSPELLVTAHENLVSTIEALLYPVVRADGYSVCFVKTVAE